MKKNVMMRIASILLVCVLATTCAISGTFAKYTTKATSSDSARVAKWGVTIEGAADNKMFGTSHTDTGDGYEAVSVQSTTDVVAPGTDGTFTQFTVTGTPEVAVEVIYTVEEFQFANWEVDGDEYCPIIITISNNGTKTDYYVGMTTEVDTIAKLIEKVTEAIVACGTTYVPGTTLETEGVFNNDLVISWRWEFNNDTNLADKTDDNDTKLGDASADAVATPEITDDVTITLKVTCTINQLN